MKGFLWAAIAVGCVSSAYADEADTFYYSGVLTSSIAYGGGPLLANVGDSVFGSVQFVTHGTEGTPTFSYNWFVSFFVSGHNYLRSEIGPGPADFASIYLSQTRWDVSVNAHDRTVLDLTWTGMGPDGLAPEAYRPYMPGFGTGALHYFLFNDNTGIGGDITADLTMTSHSVLIPEPTTITAMGIGSLILIRRRRRRA